MNKFIIILFSVLLLNCFERYPVYQGEKIEISYQRVPLLKDGEWIEIDGRRFTHVQRVSEADKIPFSLPTTEVIMSEKNDKVFTDKINSSTVALHIARYLRQMNFTSKDDLKYIFHEQPKLSLMGILTISKSDSSDVVIRTSEGYLPLVKVLKK